MIANQLSLISLPESEYAFTSDDRYTPERYFLDIQRTLGEHIGLDPCSDLGCRVPALHHLAVQDDCLTTDWKPLLKVYPTVFMNPPYSDSAPFLNRLCQYVRSGKCQIAVTLTLAGALFNLSTQPMFAELAVAVIAPRGRINFVGGGSSNDRDVLWALWVSPDYGARKTKAAIKRFGQSFDGLLMEIKQ